MSQEPANCPRCGHPLPPSGSHCTNCAWFDDAKRHKEGIRAYVLLLVIMFLLAIVAMVVAFRLIASNAFAPPNTLPKNQPPRSAPTRPSSGNPLSPP